MLCGQGDGLAGKTKLIFAFRSCAKAPKNEMKETEHSQPICKWRRNGINMTRLVKDPHSHEQHGYAHISGFWIRVAFLQAKVLVGHLAKYIAYSSKHPKTKRRQKVITQSKLGKGEIRTLTALHNLSSLVWVCNSAYYDIIRISIGNSSGEARIMV